MRQRGMSENDLRFKKALENMRYCSCTKDDIDCLLSRICRPGIGTNLLKDARYRAVSMITARNSHRDAINSLRAKEFALTRGLALTSFVSVDTWGQTKDHASIRRAQREYDAIVDPVRTSDSIGRGMQEILWNLPPTFSDHHAGTLSLCKGMPVLLKYNEATELCATNGAEAVVVEWHSHTIPGNRQVLDVLFVELTSPPRQVQLPNLPPNVIPLTRTKKTVRCTLPIDDMQVSIGREQVMILPNFAMTDFASQGRTRVANIVHLKHCKNHQSIYTCLSRSSSLEGTVIFDMFDTSKIRGGASAALRREFRELELLDEITRLRKDGSLPSHVRGTTRGPLLASFQAWKGKRYVPSHVHPAIDWKNAPDSELSPCTNTEAALKTLLSPVTITPAPVGAPVHTSTEQHSVPASSQPLKRPRSGEQWDPRPKKRKTLKDASAYDADSLVWDSNDWSCAYDSLLTVMINIFADFGPEWFSTVAPGNTYMDIIRPRLPPCLNEGGAGESMRDLLRDVLFTTHPDRFPRRGRTMMAVSDLLACLFYCPISFARSSLVCRSCTAESVHVVDVGRSYAWYLTPAAFRTNHPGQSSLTTSEYVECLLTTGIEIHCPTCRSLNKVTTTLTQAPPLLVLETSPVVTIRPEANLSLPVNDVMHTWRLTGAIYHGFDHFTSRYVDPAGSTWYHDGDITKNRCIRDIDILNNPVAGIAARGRNATHFVYTSSQ
ncbi:uncharacterized protein TRAVEDRAFT_135837 [Trametes versicolor FP-101664 SS1]|uniref:uncharacterized protein n=1 Tax=Trametes versicolor (strain FP-101664) TaxID=717944 RepID=UPI0004623C84|nr:uncharacterized protein TRAVEDRAFT_135837 [Trametes versicolor FP-101664 SS1]EIW52162.1 hypothetical protein TRAVEDRAFT_135837 [Trametes versicolor FP-101664 SS1]